MRELIACFPLILTIASEASFLTFKSPSVNEAVTRGSAISSPLRPNIFIISDLAAGVAFGKYPIHFFITSVPGIVSDIFIAALLYFELIWEAALIRAGIASIP